MLFIIISGPRQTNNATNNDLKYIRRPIKSYARKMSDLNSNEVTETQMAAKNIDSITNHAGEINENKKIIFKGSCM